MHKQNIFKIGGILIDSPIILNSLLAKIFSKNSNPIIVFSAISKSSKELKEMIKLAELDDYKKKLNLLIDFHLDFVETNKSITTILKLKSELESYLSAIATIGESTSFANDKILSFGERLAAVIYYERSKALDKNVKLLDAEKFIFCNNNQELDLEKSINACKSLCYENSPILMAGFIATNEEGNTSNMGFESSNLTSIAVALALGITDVNWISDVDGIFNADPKVFSNAKLIKNISYNEAKYLAELKLKMIPLSALNLVTKNNLNINYLSKDLIIGTNINKTNISNNYYLIVQDCINIIGNPKNKIKDILELDISESITIKDKLIKINSENIDLEQKIFTLISH